MKNRGHLWRQSFSWAPQTSDLAEVREMEPGERTGTTITFYASPEIFETTVYSLETITNRLREMAAPQQTAEIVVRDERERSEHILESAQDDGPLAPVTQMRSPRARAGRWATLQV
ncbi:MAG: hypothetical protein R2709_10795 [Marmoricola sp.]